MTLLFGCFVSCNDIAACDLFIDRLGEGMNSGGVGEIVIDVEACCKILIDAGWFESALKLCKKKRMHYVCMDVYIIHLKDLNGAIRYFEILEDSEFVFGILKEWGDVLMEIEGEKVLNVSEKYFMDPKVFLKHIDDVLVVFLVEMEVCVKLIVFLLQVHYGVLIIGVNLSVQSLDQIRILELLTHTLFHLYVLLNRSDEALNLLKDPNTKFNSYTILVTCADTKFKSGTTFIYQKEKMYRELVEIYMEESSFTHLFECLQNIE